MTEAEKEAREAALGGDACEAFAWVGQPFTHCDDCGNPYWEHTHIHGVGRDFGTLVPITPDDADRVRAKWGATMSDEREEVHVYTVNRWDCPGCGEVVESDADMSGDDKCGSCGMEVVLV